MRAADAGDRLDVVRQAELELEAAGGEARGLPLGGQDLRFGDLAELARALVRGAAAGVEAGDLAVEAREPLADGLGRDLERAGGGLDPVRLGVEGHPQAEEAWVLGLAHDGVVCVGTHVGRAFVCHDSEPSSCVLLIGPAGQFLQQPNQPLARDSPRNAEPPRGDTMSGVRPRGFPDFCCVAYGAHYTRYLLSVDEAKGWPRAAPEM